MVDGLVELLIQVTHRITVKAERRVVDKLAVDQSAGAAWPLSADNACPLSSSNGLQVGRIVGTR